MPAGRHVSEIKKISETAPLRGILGRALEGIGLTGDAAIMQEAPPDGGAHLDHDEVLAAIDGLSAEDRLKLDGIEGVLRRGTQFARRGLVHEAICRVIMGDRRCPKGVSFMAFLVMTMKSIASHDRDQRWKTLQLVPRHGEAPVAPSDLPADQLNPEEHLIEQQSVDTVRQIHDEFPDDPDAQLVIMGWADGCRGRQLREETGLDQAGLDYSAKRIRARMKKRYPSGWIP
jgi:DNA-directed RNA polymerase specialized sigma24 family protein